MPKTGTLFMVTQYEPYLTREKIDTVIDDDMFKSAAYSKHDKEPNDKVHYHIVIQTKSPTTISSIANKFDVEQQYVEWGKTSLKYMTAYMVHANDTSKVAYGLDSIIYSNYDVSKYIEEVKQQASLSLKPILDKIERGEIFEYNIQQYVSMLQYVKYEKQFKTAFRYNDMKHRGVNRDMEVWYVYGKAGSGKSTFAKNICEYLKYSVYISAGGANPLDDYKGEDAVIMDDARPSSWKFSDFLKLTDNNTSSMIGTRYYNKYFYRCKLMIVTNCEHLKEWYTNLKESDIEASEQLERRFSRIIRVKGIKNNTIYAHDELNDNIILIKAFEEYKPKTHIDITGVTYGNPNFKTNMTTIKDTDELNKIAEEEKYD